MRPAVPIDARGSAASIPPIPDEALFVAADEPLLIFPSIGAAEEDLEAVDVEDGVYEAAYGLRGERYWITTDCDRVIILPVSGPDRPEELKHLLLDYLADDEAADAEKDISELATLAWARQFSRTHDAPAKLASLGCLALIFFAALCLYLTYP